MKKNQKLPIEQLSTILLTILNYYQVDAQFLFQGSRRRHIVYKRQMFFHFAQKYLESVLQDEEIGAVSLLHGCKLYDRNTVRHAVQTIEHLISYDKLIRVEYNEIDDAIQQALGLKNEATQEILEKIRQLMNQTPLTSEQLARAYNINHKQVLEYTN